MAQLATWICVSSLFAIDLLVYTKPGNCSSAADNETSQNHLMIRVHFFELAAQRGFLYDVTPLQLGFVLRILILAAWALLELGFYMISW